MIDCLGELHGDDWSMYHGDCVHVCRQMPENSVHLSVFSPPFASLYIYSDSAADMGNCAGDGEFLEQYRFLARELFRITKPGRQCWVHCKELVYYQNQRGTAGLRDFPGDLIRAHIEAGWDFHSRRTIRRDPVREMQKTKAHGLLYKQLRADSTFSRAGLPEYFVVFRKWAADGEEAEPVEHTKSSFPLEQWQRWADPVWTDTRETDVLNVDAARENGDEKHICPMPLDLTERAVVMGSNPGDVVLSPFAGIGSEGVVALRNKRRFIGIELKESYFRQAGRFLTAAERESATLFDLMGAA